MASSETISRLITLFEPISWCRLKCSKAELRLDITLKCGQSFRWQDVGNTNAESSPNDERDNDAKSFMGVLKGRVWLLSQTDDEISYKYLPDHNDDSAEKVLIDYFQLKISLRQLYKQWCSVDPVMASVAKEFQGVRILRQDPTENLFSFICSANNNIQRISSMVEKLCTFYGDRITLPSNSLSVYSFPSIQKLASISTLEAELRAKGFGYRAAYISKTAKTLLSKGSEDYLLGLRELDYHSARSELLQLSGIGPKVADCILLMSLDKPDAIPVDTHMMSIAATHYLPQLKSYKSITDKVYRDVSDHFRELYGSHAGWAHSVLFSADLRHLKRDLQTVRGLEKDSSKLVKNKRRKGGKPY